MSKETEFEKALLDLVEMELLDQTKSDLQYLYSSNSLEEVDDFRTTKSLIDTTLNTHRKNRLLKARQELNSVQANSAAASSTIKDAKKIIIGLMLSDRLPKALTFAFREGQDIPDEEVESIIQDLRELGIEIDDE
ncbi:Uncharacterised protein [Halioglobus japonicus]|nr:Uncharacterised protein [Halioglobus japonicus]